VGLIHSSGVRMYVLVLTVDVVGLLFFIIACISRILGFIGPLHLHCTDKSLRLAVIIFSPLSSHYLLSRAISTPSPSPFVSLFSSVPSSLFPFPIALLPTPAFPGLSLIFSTPSSFSLPRYSWIRYSGCGRILPAHVLPLADQSSCLAALHDVSVFLPARVDEYGVLCACCWSSRSRCLR
jgi:hypothetical protein